MEDVKEDKPVELKPSEEKGPELGPETGLEEIDFAPLLDYFDIDRPSLHEKNDLRELHQLLDAGNLTKGELMSKLRHLEIRLGAPPTGENRLRRIINFLALDKQIEELIKEQQGYIR